MPEPRQMKGNFDFGCPRARALSDLYVCTAKRMLFDMPQPQYWCCSMPTLLVT